VKQSIKKIFTKVVQLYFHIEFHAAEKMNQVFLKKNKKKILYSPGVFKIVTTVL